MSPIISKLEKLVIALFEKVQRPNNKAMCVVIACRLIKALDYLRTNSSGTPCFVQAPPIYLLKYQKLFTDPARLSFVIFKMASLKVILLIYDSLLAPKTKPLLFPQIHLPPFSNKKLQKIESFYLGNTLGNYKSNLNKINEVTIISILRFTWNSSLLSFF